MILSKNQKEIRMSVRTHGFCLVQGNFLYRGNNRMEHHGWFALFLHGDVALITILF